MLLSNLVSSFMMPYMASNYHDGVLNVMGESWPLPEALVTAFEMTLEIPQIVYVILTVLYALSLTGVILMWNLRKSGFHYYTLAQLLILLVPALFMGKGHLAIGDVMLTLLFVAYYFFTLKQLGVFSSDNETPASDDSNDDSLVDTEDNL